MKRRTLLATIGTGSLIGAAGCYGADRLLNGDGDQQASGTAPSNESAKNGSDGSESGGNDSEGDGTEENTTDQESNESGDNANESEDGEAEGNESNETDESGEENETEGSSRPSDPVDTISLTDHGIEINDSPEQDVDKEVYCYGKLKNGGHALRKVRVDAVALAKDGTRLDHSWKPFARLEPGETFEVRFRFFVDPSEMHEYLVGATEATYAEGDQ